MEGKKKTLKGTKVQWVGSHFFTESLDLTGPPFVNDD